MAMLQAHRGVSTEYPENTMTAYLAAIEQGYEYIELDPEVTKDGVPVLLHDANIGRTARNADGSIIENAPRISDITYAEALEYDFGIAFHKKFKGENIPRLSEALELARANGVKVKLDNKIWRFDSERRENVLTLCAEYPKTAAITCTDAEQIKSVLSVIPSAEIHYDGTVNEKTLSKISALVPKDRLTVWLPIECKSTSWVKVPFVSEYLCDIVKKCAKLGIWIVSEYSDYDRAVNVYGADTIETNGQIKPVKNQGLLTDMHSHTESSHDAKSTVDELCEAEISRKVSVLAITDHFDGVAPDERDPFTVALSSTADAEMAKEKYKDKLTVLKGTELGEAFWAKEHLKKVEEHFTFDVKIGSVHAVRYKDMREPFSVMDFSDIPLETVEDYYSQYLDDMIENLESVDFDILAHLDNPQKYIKGKYGIELDGSRYRSQVDRILRFIVDHGIALEINTATYSIYGDNMPSSDIVRRWRELGGYIVTVGADSHIPENAAKHLDKALDLIKSLGLRNVFYYKNRRSYQVTL